MRGFNNWFKAVLKRLSEFDGREQHSHFVVSNAIFDTAEHSDFGPGMHVVCFDLGLVEPTDGAGGPVIVHEDRVRQILALVETWEGIDKR